METVYLVDGSGYIFRAYYAVQSLSNSRGFPTNALYGFARMVTKLLRDVNARYIAVTFDTSAPTFRHEMYSAYKANRLECPADLVLQLPYFRRLVEAFGLRFLEKPGVEADDIIATLALRLRAAGNRVVIVSGDKDLTQLVTDGIEVWDAMRDNVFDRQAVKAKFDVYPEQMLDYLALVGDSSDNVPGIKGIGPKTASKLLEHFGTLDNLLENLNAIEEIKGLRGAASVRKAIEEGAEILSLSRRLVALCTDVEPFSQLTGAADLLWHEPHVEQLVPLFEELEFSNLLDEFPFLSADCIAKARQDTGGKPEKDYRIITEDTLAEFAASLASQSVFAFDTETTSLDVFDCRLVGMSFSWERGKAYYLPLGGEVERERQLDAERVKELLGPFFADSGVKKIGLNLKFDIGVLEEHGYAVEGQLFDSMLCSYVLHPDSRQHGLKTLAQQYLGEAMVTYEQLLGDCDNISQVAVDRVAQYACHDAEMSWVLAGILESNLGDRGEQGSSSLRRVFEEVEMPLVKVLSRMERKGIKVDAGYLASLDREFGDELAGLEREISRLAGVEFNINSPKQLAQILFEKLKIPTLGVKKTKSGLSTDAEVLRKLLGQHEIIRQLLEYRELHKLKSTYIQALNRLIQPKTGRIHTSFNQAVTATGRLSSSEPNLQNIPIRNPRGRRIRAAFVAEPGFLLLSADYSQIELRVLAHLSGDSALGNAFFSGEDIHLRTAKELFGALAVSGAEIKEYRRIAKTINFGIIYGMGAFRLAQDLGVTRKQAQKYIDDYFARYPKVREYFDRLNCQINERGYVETLFGRRRYLKDVDTSGRDAGYASRSLLNAPIQGSAAEIIKLAMIKLNRRLDESAKRHDADWAAMVLQVHDELVFEVKEDSLSALTEMVITEMESAVELSVPLKVDVRIGKSWGME